MGIAQDIDSELEDGIEIDNSKTVHEYRRPDHDWTALNVDTPYEFRSAQVAGIGLGIPADGSREGGTVHAFGKEHKVPWTENMNETMLRRGLDIIDAARADYVAQAKTMGVDLT